MLKVWNYLPRVAAITLLTAAGLAQSAPTAKFYKLEFVVKEVDGNKVLNARAYSTTVSTDPSNPRTQIRTMGRVPTPLQPGSTQYNYLDLGVNIDCDHVREEGSDLSLVVTVDVSTQAPPAPDLPSAPPVLRQNKWSSVVLLPIRKPVVVFSSDDPGSKRQMQLEITATPIR